MSSSSMKRGVSAKDLPEVFNLKKEVQFEAWRKVFSHACRILGLRKILNSTPAVKDRTAGFTATSAAAETRLASLWRSEPKIPVKFKELKPDLTTIKEDQRQAAMVEYLEKMEKADAVFDKEWVRYLVEKQTYDSMLIKAQEDVSKYKNMDPTLDDDVIEIHPRAKKEGTKTYEYKATFQKTQSLDACRGRKAIWCQQ